MIHFCFTANEANIFNFPAQNTQRTSTCAALGMTADSASLLYTALYRDSAILVTNPAQANSLEQRIVLPVEAPINVAGEGMYYRISTDFFLR